MQKNKKTKKFAKGIATVAALFLVASPIQAFAAETNSASALSSLSGNVSIYEIDMNDQTPLETLKEKVITKYVESSATLSMSNIDLENSTITTDAFNRTQSGLQTVRISVTIATTADEEGETVSAGLSHTETAAVKLVEPEGPQIVLKNTEVTVDLGSTFSYADNIGILSTKDGLLPVITEEDDIDIETEGTYTVTITAIDGLGGKSTVSYDVIVEKPAEVIRAEEEAAAEAQRLAEEQAAAEAAAQAAAEEAAALAAAQAAATTATYDVASNPTGSSIADYALSFVGCSYVWGGASPSGFDCSGFTQYVYAAFGYSLAHSSYSQESAGTIISIDQAEAGDLVTWNGHCGIYIGNGMVVNAMNPSQGVAVCSIYAITNGNMLIHRLS